MAKKILLFSCDPGGSNTIIPLVVPLIEKGYEVELYGKDFALHRYVRFGLNGKDIAKEIEILEVREIRDFLKREKFDFIITGTSANDFTEKYIWEAAGFLGIPSMAILDQWLNYGIRFSKYGLKDSKKYDLDKKHEYLHSKIAVMDEYAKSEMVNEGLDSSLIKVLGQPYFELLNRKVSDVTREEMIEKRNLLFGKKVNFVVTFASEAIAQTYQESDNSKHYLGYTERSIFKEFVEALGNIQSDKNIGVIIKLHPRERRDNYFGLVTLLRERKIEFLVEDELNSWELIKISDLVCGMISMFLIESVILGKPVISIQIGLKQKNPFVLDRRGILKSVLDRGTLIKELKKIIVDNNIPKYSFDVISNPVANIIEYVEKSLCQN